MVTKNVFELTQEGVNQLKEELAYLLGEARDKNIEALQEARAQGDLSENADYDAAREEQSRIESRILELQNILKNVKIIAESTDDSKVTIGKNIKVEFVGKGLTKEYKLVGTIEANPFDGKISNESPLGKAILNKKVGSTIKFKSETGKELEVKIISID